MEFAIVLAPLVITPQNAGACVLLAILLASIVIAAHGAPDDLDISDSMWLVDDKFVPRRVMDSLH
jgi:hypothetical protein